MPQVSIKIWFEAARLRTLPLSVSGILVGSSLAITNNAWDTSIFVFAIITTILLQVLSNFANDYGDGVKGTDNENRIGPKRALQSGAISPSQMLTAIKATAFLSLVAAFLLIYSAFAKEELLYISIFMILGILAIAAAIKYTMGSNAYGYRGLGDVFVFVFFGLVSVCGSYFLFTKSIESIIFLPAISIGLLSTAVLNLNNMRDHDSDTLANKITIVVKMGVAHAKTYHFALIILATLSSLSYFVILEAPLFKWVPLLAFIPLGMHFRRVWFNQDAKLLDPELKKVALSTFLLALLFLISSFLN
jgi:1,4-dihydroxy-2-naphthoate octaprenyltransferase